MIPLIPRPKTIATINEYCEYEFHTAKEINKTFKSQIVFQNMNVLDLGCGLGGQTAYFSLKGANTVVGVDINKKWIDIAAKYAKEKQANKKVDFILVDGAYLPIRENNFDIIMMYDVLEHLPQANKVLQECKRVLKLSGFLYVSFGPPWLNPYGGHLWSHIPIPWCHLIFSEKTLANVLKKSKSLLPITEVGHEITQFRNLGKMTIRKFKEMIKKTNLEIKFFEERFKPRGLSILGFFPFIKEFFISSVVCILKKTRKD